MGFEVYFIILSNDDIIRKIAVERALGTDHKNLDSNSSHATGLQLPRLQNKGDGLDDIWDH